MERSIILIGTSVSENSQDHVLTGVGSWSDNTVSTTAQQSIELAAASAGKDNANSGTRRAVTGEKE